MSVCGSIPSGRSDAHAIEETHIRFQENAQVLTADGEAAGTIERFVVDPDQTAVTHLVLKPGAPAAPGRLVPVDVIERSAEDGTIVLSSGVDPENFDPFVETRYDRATVDRPMFGAPGVALFPLADAPGDYVGWSSDRGAPTSAAGDQPEGTQAVEVGTPVMTVDGRRLGKVHEVVTLEDGRIDGFVARSGILWWRRHWLIPHSWVHEISDAAVHLGSTYEHVRDHAERQPLRMTRTE